MKPNDSTPTWDLTTYFPAFDGPEYHTFRTGLEDRLAALSTRARAIGALSPASAPAWAEWVEDMEGCARDAWHLFSYIGCLCAADSRNEATKAEEARLSTMSATFAKVVVPFRAALREATREDFEALRSHPKMHDISHRLDRELHEARKSMSPELEDLAADLAVDGIMAWGRLYSTISGALTFDLVKPDGTVEQVPMAQRSTLLNDGNREIRLAAFKGANEAWSKHADTLAACLNGIAGSRLQLNKRRGIAHYLDVAMFGQGVKRETIETMMSVLHGHRAELWKFLSIKARLLGVERLGFPDLAAPFPFEDDRRFSWEEGTAMILRAFDDAYPALADFSRDMINGKRIDAQRRDGKRPGGFCTSSPVAKTSHVFMTYGGSVDDMRTLAHELGHAFHNYVLRDRRTFARRYQMTLAETASTFAEGLFMDSLLNDPSTGREQRLAMHGEQLDNAVAFMMNVPMRYDFECAFTDARQDGEVSVSQLKEFVVSSQKKWYGDSIDPELYDPWFWASKLHFYISDVTFYNFPYSFGYLLSQGLIARFRKEGAGFLPTYENFLRISASDTAEGVAYRSLGVDLTQAAFWEEAVGCALAGLPDFERNSMTK